ncbi:MAG: hypothetical protein WC620_05170 [Methanoregula sp.]|jgi:hypothetical protein
MELSFDRKVNAEERLAFVRSYAAWVKRMLNAEWSRQQAALIDSFVLNARNMPLTSREYLERVAREKESIDSLKQRIAGKPFRPLYISPKLSKKARYI